VVSHPQILSWTKILVKFRTNLLHIKGLFALTDYTSRYKVKPKYLEKR
jgi:hypothetical protein